MYIGRFVVLGRTKQGACYLGYRVSSRSFPNRVIRIVGDRAMVLPTAEAPRSDNPYISYNCLRRHGDVAVIANGSHVDPAIDKVSAGYPLRDALAMTLLAMDYEHDSYNTPRIAAALHMGHSEGYLAIVAADKLLVQGMHLALGEAFLIATYELTDPTPVTLAGDTPEALCDALFDCAYEHPVASLATVAQCDTWRVAARAAP